MAIESSPWKKNVSNVNCLRFDGRRLTRVQMTHVQFRCESVFRFEIGKNKNNSDDVIIYFRNVIRGRVRQHTFPYSIFAYKHGTFSLFALDTYEIRNVSKNIECLAKITFFAAFLSVRIPKSENEASLLYDECKYLERDPILSRRRIVTTLTFEDVR